MDYLTILDFVAQYGITQDSLPQPVPLPQPLPANAGLRLAVREIYGWTDEQINITNPLPQVSYGYNYYTISPSAATASSSTFVSRT